MNRIFQLILLFLILFNITTVYSQTVVSQPTITLVFHILKHDQDEYLSDDRIKSQLDVLNEDFNLLNLNASTIPVIFQSSIGNAGINFNLATKDPSGQLTDGINRYETTKLLFGDKINAEGFHSIKFKAYSGADSWDTNNYLNIWVGAKTDVIAQATFPEDAGSDFDGIIIDPKFLGRLENSNTPLHLGRVLTHEIGHYLGLNHPWGELDECNLTDDGISDTPTQKTIYFGCPTHPQISCNSADMFMNFMNFCDDACISFFTKGQVNLMHQTLELERSGLAKIEIIEKSELLEFNYWLNNSTLTIMREIPLQDETFFDLIDYNGRLWMTHEFTNKYFLEINTNKIPLGVYILRLRNKNDVKSQKVFLSNK